MDAWMIVPGWVRGQSTPKGMGVTLERVVDHMDHICQLAGNANHIGIGSDLDGAFGKEQSPHDIDTIADLQKIRGILRNRGYNETDIENVMSENWLRFLRNAWKS
jgi:membrane dipeptidase